MGTRPRIKVTVNIGVVGREINAKLERKKQVYSELIKSIMQENKMSYIEAKSFLKKDIAYKSMVREMNLIR